MLTQSASEALDVTERVRITALKRDMQSEKTKTVERREEREALMGASDASIEGINAKAGSKRQRDEINAAGGSASITSSAATAASSSNAIMSTALAIRKETNNEDNKNGASEQHAKMEEARRQSLKKHKPWKVKKVLMDHLGWVRCIAIDPSNEWFATGSVDTVVKVWDLSTGKLRQNFTGHKEPVRGIAISSTSPYMFTCSDDRSVKCWDLEMNRIIRDYHGHNGSVAAIAAHPDLDLIVTASRDKSVKLWDVRSQQCVHTLQGHKDAVMSVLAQSTEPQIISSGADSVVYLWDIRKGMPITNLTRHKKPVEALVAHKTEETLVSIGSDNVRKWKLPLGVFYTNMVHETVRGAHAEGPWCCGALSPWGELCVGGRDGTLRFYDWSTNILLQQTATKGMQGGEKGILCCAFDASGKRLITGEVDKTIKIWEPREASN